MASGYNELKSVLLSDIIQSFDNGAAINDLILCALISAGEPKPVIAQAVIATSISSKNQPVGISTSFLKGQNNLVYYVRYTGAKKNETNLYVQLFKDGNALTKKMKSLLHHPSGNVWWSFKMHYLPGNYKIMLTFNNEVIKTSYFNITP